MAYATSTYLAIAAIAATTVSTGVSIYSQQQQAKTQERAAAYNAELARREAKNRELESAEQIRRERIENRRRMARIRSQLSHQGIATTTGTPLAILGESAADLELGIADAVRRTSIEAASLRAQGQMGLWEADQASRAANINSVATGIAGVGKAFGSYTGSVYDGSLPDTFGIYRTKPTA